MRRRNRLLLGLSTCVIAFVAIELVLGGLGGVLLTPRQATPAKGGPRTLVCAGDSVTFGYGLPPSEAWPAQLARRPAVAAAGIEVRNLGISGQDLARIAQALNPTLDFDTSGERAVVVLGGHNDCAALGVPLPTASSAVVSRARRVLRSLATYRLLSQVVARARPPEVIAPSDARAAGCAARIASGVATVRDVVGRARVPLLFTTYPVAPEPERGLVNAYVNEAVLTAATSAGVPSFDLAACLAGAGPEGLLQADGVHLTAAGGAAVAACLEAPVLALFGGR